MLSYYRRVRLSTRLIGLGLAEALVFAIVLRNYPLVTLLPALGGAAGALVLLDIVLRRRQLVLAAAVGLGQALLSTYGAVTVASLAGASSTSQSVQNGFAFLFLQAFALLALLVHVAWTTYFARGHVWFNLLVASAILDFGFVGFATIANLPLLWAVPAALGASLLYLGARTVRFKRPVLWRAPARNKATLTGAQEALATLKLTVHPGQEPADFYASDEWAVLVVATIEAKAAVRLSGQGFEVEGEDLTPLLAQLATEAQRVARTLRISRSRVHPVVFTRKAGLNPPLRSVRVRSRKAPDRTLGTVYLANQKGLNRLLAGTRGARQLSAKAQRRLSRLSA